MVDIKNLPFTKISFFVNPLVFYIQTYLIIDIFVYVSASYNEENLYFLLKKFFAMIKSHNFCRDIRHFICSELFISELFFSNRQKTQSI